MPNIHRCKITEEPQNQSILSWFKRGDANVLINYFYLSVWHFLKVIKAGPPLSSQQTNTQIFFFLFFFFKAAGSVSERFLCVFWRLHLRPQEKCLIWHQVWKQCRQNENRELNVIKSHIFISWQRWGTYMGKADSAVSFSSRLSITV